MLPTERKFGSFLVERADSVEQVARTKGKSAGSVFASILEVDIVE